VPQAGAQGEQPSFVLPDLRAISFVAIFEAAKPGDAIRLPPDSEASASAVICR
jgi:hypothetical protein